MSHRFAKLLATATIALVAVTGGTLPAHAEDAPIAPETLSYLTASFNELGVAPSARGGLLEKYAAGGVFDNSSGVAPISVDDYRVGITDYVREVYPDGSVSLTSVERPTTPTSTEGITAFAISGCSYSLSTGVASYTNCLVKKNNGVLTELFHANYSRWSGGSSASLTNTWDWDIQAAGGACSKEMLGNTTSNTVRIRAYCTVVAGIGSAYPYLELTATPSGATDAANW